MTGNAVTLDGETIKVTFESESVADGTLAHIVSINTQMDGGGEYSPLKITTASVSCLVDGAELMRLCVSEQPVSVIIENVEQESILFKGYVVPNSYNQALSGINDTITIECVDGLGYAKYVPYTRIKTNNNVFPPTVEETEFQVRTLAQIFAAAIEVLNLSTYRIPNAASLSGDGGTTVRYDLLTISENAMFTGVDPVEDGKGLSYGPVAKSWHDVLKMIAESLRLTWVQIGDTLWLIDDIKIAREDIVYYRQPNLFTVAAGNEYDIDEESFAATTCNVSSLPTYAQVVMTHTQRDSLRVSPELLMTEYVEPLGEAEYIKVGDGYIALQEVTSLVYDTPGVKIYAYKAYDERSERPTYDDTWELFLRSVFAENQDKEYVEMFRVKELYRGAVATTDGLKLKINLEVGGERWPWEDAALEADLLLSLRISVTRNGATKYYDASSRSAWSGTMVDNDITLNKDGEWKFTAGGRRDGSVLLDSGGGTISVVLVSKEVSWRQDVWLRAFDVEVVADKQHIQDKEYRGEWAYLKSLDVSLLIDNYYRLSDINWGNIIDGIYYKDILIDGEKLIDRVWSQVNHGDRLMWEMALRDEANAITPLDAFTCAQLWSGRKVVAGYTRDIINNQIIVTLV